MDLLERDARRASITETFEQVCTCVAARLVMPTTPVAFQRFSRRKCSWVGEFSQTGLLPLLGPNLVCNPWLVGNSILPGQSTAVKTLGSLRVAQTALRQIKINVPNTIALSQVAIEVGV